MHHEVTGTCFIIGGLITLIAIGWMLIARFDDSTNSARSWRHMPWRWLLVWFTAWLWLPWLVYGVWSLPWRYLDRILPPTEPSRIITRFDPNGGVPFKVEK